MFLAICAARAPGQEPEQATESMPSAAQEFLLPELSPGRANAEPGRANAERGAGGPEAEAEEPLETDRDAFTPSTKTASPGRFIVEAAYSYLDNPRTPATQSYPELFVRYGLTERIELRLGWNYEVGGRATAISGALTGELGEEEPKIEHARFLFYGVKVALTEQSKLVPESVLLLQGLTPTRGEGTATEILLGYVFGWKLANDWKLDSAIRVGTASPTGAVWSPSTVLRIPLGTRWGVHLEYFGQFTEDHVPVFVHHFFSSGVRYLITPDLEIGVRLGCGLNEQTTRFFANAGFGWRF
jgi:hypothetical protein